ncbi:MAG: cupredoxin domain-containing protein [bacterium]|nr:cupredoxin domain-containing protein [bacterium]
MEKDPMSPDVEDSTVPVSEKKHVPVFIGVIVILLIAGAIYWFMSDTVQAPQEDLMKIDVQSLDTDNAIPVTASDQESILLPNIGEENPPLDIMTDGNSDETMISDESNVQIINVIAANFSFTQNEIRVKKGDTVRINLINNEGTHDFLLDEFSVKIPRLQSGETKNAEFTVDKTGTFEYYCSVGNHRALGMKGTLIVE